MRAQGSGGGTAEPATSYLPAGRAGPLQLAVEIARAARSPIVEALLVGSGTALAVLNAERQIVALNGAYLELLGARSAASVLGMRPGEAAACVHADEAPGGCGTSRACPSCGAAVALLLATARHRAGERDCALRVERDGRIVDHVFRARAMPLDLDGQELVLLSLADVGAERRRAALQRAFLHDLANLATGIASAASALAEGAEEEPPVVDDLQALSARLVREVQLQRALANGGDAPAVARRRVDLAAWASALSETLGRHPAASDRRIDVDAARGARVDTDPFLLDQVVAAMLVNALEATPPGGAVRLEACVGHDAARVRAWNAGAIPDAVRPRIFQRYFTTKPGEGRGHGTFAMRLFAERLGGDVSFTSSAEDGTWFELVLPLRGCAAR